VRILHLSDFFAPDTGGMDRHIQTLADEQRRQGHDVRIAAMATGSDVGADPEHRTPGGVPVHRLASTSRRLAGTYEDASNLFHPPAPDPELVLALGRLVRRHHPEVLHAHSWCAYSALALPAADRPPVVVTLHDHGFACSNKTLVRQPATDATSSPCPGPSLRRCPACVAATYGVARGSLILATHLASRPLLKRPARFIAVSASVRDALVAPGIVGRDRITVIPNMTGDAAPSGSARPGFVPDGPYALFVGALGPHKGVTFLASLWASRAMALPLVLIGGRRADMPLSWPEGVVVQHDVPHDQVLAAWEHATLGLVPSLWADPCPTVALEAMGAGLAVIVSDRGGLPDQVEDGVSGVVLPAGDAPAWTAEINALFRDDARRRTLGEAARVRVRSFGVVPVAERIEAVYREVLRQEPG